MSASSWFRHVYFNLDASIKSHDKDLYHFIYSLIEAEGFRVVEDASESGPSFFSVKVVFMSEDERSLKTESDIILKFSEKNMNLFSAKDHSEGISFYDEKDFNEALSLTKYLVKQRIDVCNREIFNKGLQNLKKRTTPKKLNEIQLTRNQVKIIDEFETQIYKQLDFNGINNVLDHFRKILGRHYKVVDPSDIYINPKNDFFTFGDEKSLKILLMEGEDNSNFDLSVYNIISESSKRFKIKESGRAILLELEEIFSKLNIPIAIFNKEEQIVLHNAHFVNLNISAKKAFSLKVNDQVTIEKEVYKVQKVFLTDGQLVHINFIPVRQVLGKTNNPSSEELGIVSSSIAHELNNPLGGILAAINVLELDEVGNETQQKYEQMKESVVRCKKLVETFLGFSRMKPEEKISQVRLTECFEQALDLVRFRLIESNITFKNEYLIEEDYNGQANPYVISMLFYLFLGEILTNFSHQKLITQKGVSPKISVKFFEKSSAFGIEILEDVKVSETFVQSKLIQHLLNSQQLNLSAKLNKFMFY